MIARCGGFNSVLTCISASQPSHRISTHSLSHSILFTMDLIYGSNGGFSISVAAQQFYGQMMAFQHLQMNLTMLGMLACLEENDSDAFYEDWDDDGVIGNGCLSDSFEDIDSDQYYITRPASSFLKERDDETEERLQWLKGHNLPALITDKSRRIVTSFPVSKKI
jgi:hypothetical protein